VNFGTTSPSARRRSLTSSVSSTSSVRACTTAAREVLAPSARRSSSTRSTPLFARVAARARPVGPAPTMTTSVRVGSEVTCSLLGVVVVDAVAPASTTPVGRFRCVPRRNLAGKLYISSELHAPCRTAPDPRSADRQRVLLGGAGVLAAGARHLDQVVAFLERDG